MTEKEIIDKLREFAGALLDMAWDIRHYLDRLEEQESE